MLQEIKTIASRAKILELKKLIDPTKAKIITSVPTTKKNIFLRISFDGISKFEKNHMNKNSRVTERIL